MKERVWDFITRSDIFDLDKRFKFKPQTGLEKWGALGPTLYHWFTLE